MKKPRKILIIKTGFSEFLDRGVSTTVSLGDVLNCTSILHLYKEDHVTWVTAWAAQKLLESNPYIDKLLIFGPEAFAKLAAQSYDILINLEKDIGICTFLNQLKAKKRYGFYFNERKHDIDTYKLHTKYLLLGQEHHRDINKTFAEILFEAVDSKWKGEDLILARQSKSQKRYDIGFNYSVGTKWPTKGWPLHHWKALEGILGERFSISWQKGHKDLIKYINWIDSCRMIVTSDSLGQVLGHALGKKVVGLYGPTNPKRMEGVHNIKTICSSLACPHMPCYLPICKHDTFCMDHIEPQKVAALCVENLK